MHYPFIHSLSSRYTTSYPFFTGKKAWFKASMCLDLPLLEEFGENSSDSLSDDIMHQSGTRPHNCWVYIQSWPPSGFWPGKLGVQENVFDLHLRRATLATTIDKSAHITKPEIPSFTEYGWSLTDGNAVSLASTEPARPLSLGKAISCSWIKGCQKNCSCVKKAIQCYLWCHCQGLETRCSRMTTWLQLEWIALYHSIIGFRSR